MASEELRLPSNGVRFNTYLAESKRRVLPDSVYEGDWYFARLISPDPTIIDQFAKDVLMKAVKVVENDGGSITIYAKSALNDGGDDEVDGSDAAPMDMDGFLLNDDQEAGYLLRVFKAGPEGLGALASEAALEATPPTEVRQQVQSLALL